jgi:hypothetical protein
MIFTTKSNSTYDIDIANKRIRRLNGNNEPQPRQGQDGEWKTYAAILPTIPQVGEILIIFWTKDAPLFQGSDKNAKPCTITSAIESVSEGLN